MEPQMNEATLRYFMYRVLDTDKYELAQKKFGENTLELLQKHAKERYESDPTFARERVRKGASQSEEIRKIFESLRSAPIPCEIPLDDSDFE
jgi:hypothetical protein